MEDRPERDFEQAEAPLAPPGGEPGEPPRDERAAPPASAPVQGGLAAGGDPTAGGPRPPARGAGGGFSWLRNLFRRGC